MSARRPAFAEGYPRTPELDALVDAFIAGNYRRVRAEAPCLAEQTDDDAVKTASLELRSRIDPDPWAIALLALAAGLLLVLSVYWLLHDGRHAPPPPNRAVEIVR